MHRMQMRQCSMRPPAPTAAQTQVRCAPTSIPLLFNSTYLQIHRKGNQRSDLLTALLTDKR